MFTRRHVFLQFLPLHLNLAFQIYLQIGITDDFDYLEPLQIVPVGSVGDQVQEGNS